MEQSEKIDLLAAALTKVQEEIKPAAFDSVNPYYKSKYASLGSVIEAAKILPIHGLAYTQLPISDGWYVGVENVLMHESGQWISQKFLMPIDTDSKNPIQEAGKAITYARRYALASMLGIYSDEDTDGNAPSQASDANSKPQGNNTAAKTAKPETGVPAASTARPYTPEQVKIRLHEIAESMQPASEAQVTLLAASIGKVLTNADIRHDAQEYLFGARSLKDVDGKLVNAGLKWINLDDDYNVDLMTAKELHSIQNAFLLSKGQQKMDDLLKEKKI
jgi:hypothetical protein